MTLRSREASTARGFSGDAANTSRDGSLRAIQGRTAASPERPLAVAPGLSAIASNRMEYRNLGRTGVKVSPLCLGTMMFGRSTNEQDSIAVIEHALDHGINFIDTANAYSAGASERFVGKALGQGGRAHGRARDESVFSARSERPERARLEPPPSHRGVRSVAASACRPIGSISTNCIARRPTFRSTRRCARSTI